MTPEQHRALLWVRNCLDVNHPEQMPDWMEFDMRTWLSGRPSCGTACCIGGSMDIYLAGYAIPNPPEIVTRLVRESPTYEETDKLTDKDLALHRLFFNWHNVDPTPENAVKAIDAYLAGSQHPWGDVK